MLEASPAHLEREGCRGSRSFADEQFVVHSDLQLSRERGFLKA